VGASPKTIVQAADHETAFADCAMLGKTYEHAEPKKDGKQEDAGHPDSLEQTEHQ
jgi:hypothetical protein